MKVYPGQDGRVHSARTCPGLHEDDAPPALVPLDAALIGAMCENCAKWHHWARPDSALGIFLCALTGMGLLYELGAHLPGPSDAGPEAEIADCETADAAALLAEGDRPAEDDEKRWQSFSDARRLRDAAFRDWLQAATSLHRALGTVAAYPWLEPWARERLTLKAGHVEALRTRAGRLVRPGALLEAAAAGLLDGDGSPLWDRWQDAAAASWSGLERHAGLGLEAGGALFPDAGVTAEWTERVRARVAALRTRPERLVLAALPAGDGRRSDLRRTLTEAELGVLAAYTVEADWGRRVMLLRVPYLVAEHLLGQRSHLACTPYAGDDAGFAPALPPPGERDAPLPGVFDDSPVAARRPVTSAHLRALREGAGHDQRRADQPQADQLYVVFSAEHGVEVLPTAAIEARCTTGWQGVLVAGAADLPASLIAPWAEQPPQQDLGPGWQLGAAAGEQELFDERSLRALALARGARDLRALDDGRDGAARAVPPQVWRALLARDRMDLRPFGGGIPLGLLADVQLYTSNADPQVPGKGHSPYCGHQHDLRLTRDDHLLTVAELLRRTDLEWCRKCGGYAVRRLAAPQLAYYRAAHRLYTIAEELRRDPGRRPAVLAADLASLASWEPHAPHRWEDRDRRQWLEIIRALEARLAQPRRR
ncbi:hypothetical protein [Actinomadura parmotrematis]|uniref:Uncharacterized protein n=1 Tax=Actinomadura parmotrematis TaxID=2864039 RepID=A0ABS7FU04_9ACTN|nr:hypothetical protein [Actinomadura parmotrematis]MBW8483890.1 hypothetical protein [Actinomadura parmotrematis]